MNITCHFYHFNINLQLIEVKLFCNLGTFDRVTSRHCHIDARQSLFDVYLYSNRGEDEGTSSTMGSGVEWMAIVQNMITIIN